MALLMADTDYVIARRTQKGTIAVEVLKDASSNWRKQYPDSGVESVTLYSGEAEAIRLQDFQLLMNSKGGRSLEAVVAAWRAARLIRDRQ